MIGGEVLPVSDTNLIGNLIEIRGRLKENVRNLERLQRKMTGPRPSDMEANKVPPPTDCLGTLVSDIGMLASHANKLIEEAHGYFGEFNPAGSSTGADSPRYA